MPLRRLTNYLLRLLNNISYERFEDLDDFFWLLATDNDFGQMDNELEATEHMKSVFFKLFARRLTDGNEGNGVRTCKRTCEYIIQGLHGESDEPTKSMTTTNDGR